MSSTSLNMRVMFKCLKQWYLVKIICMRTRLEIGRYTAHHFQALLMPKNQLHFKLVIEFKLELVDLLMFYLKHVFLYSLKLSLKQRMQLQ